MKREPLNSTSLKSAGYDPEFRILEIEFKTGNIYQYRNVPPEISHAFFEAESHGTYHNKFLKDKFLFIKID